MAIVETNRKLQVVIGTGAPVAGDLVKGGLGIQLNASGEFVALNTSSNGNDIQPLKLLSAEIQNLLDQKLDATATAVDSNKLNGKTEAELTTAIVAQISDGASTAYDTLIELENAIKANDVDIASLLSNLSNKVDKVSGKSLVDDTEISKLATLNKTTTVNASGSTSDDLPTETAVRAAIDASILKIYEY